MVFPQFHKWKYWHHCFFMKYGFLAFLIHISRQWFFCQEIWNFLYSLYQNIGANAPSWNLDFGIVHIWRSECRFSYKKYGNLYILYEPVVLRILPCVLCLHLCLCPLHVCACVAYVCVWVCAWFLPTADTEMKVTEHEIWSNERRRHEAFTD